jgi:hypothetical protein
MIPSDPTMGQSIGKTPSCIPQPAEHTYQFEELTAHIIEIFCQSRTGRSNEAQVKDKRMGDNSITYILETRLPTLWRLHNEPNRSSAFDIVSVINGRLPDGPRIIQVSPVFLKKRNIIAYIW